ncbi:peptidase M54 [Methanocella sp. CWC-04]|uniref:Peptidase M54 n=1 Tax=Methanooceanicella nereidis TaxID=2052831 RepID=A0AAP2W6W4_9EURY|nr:matrixin family metalloprotease [Methanocella sp. CWC-04]MCD1294521.1 peptidase M54 [Methanocella sp. CWC-04]
MAERSGHISIGHIILIIILSAVISISFLLPLYVHEEVVKSVGNYAPLYLYEHSPYGRIVVEVHYSPDAKPSGEALESLRYMLQQYTGKQVIVEQFQDIDPVIVPKKIDEDNIFDFGESVLKDSGHYHMGWISGDIPIYVLYVNSTAPDAQIKKDNAVAGVSYRANSFVIFKNNIAIDSIERSVLIHETGHLLGLDHDNDPSCVMTSVLVQKPSWLAGKGSPPYEFCDDHMAELDDRRRNPFYAAFKNYGRIVSLFLPD